MKIVPFTIIALLIVPVLPNLQYRAYAPLIIPSQEQLFNESSIIVVGNVISASDVQNGTKTEYAIQPQEYLKPASSGTAAPITAYGVGSKNHDPYNAIYRVGDRVLFFLEEKNVGYFIMPYSIRTKSDCNAEQLLALNYSPGDFSITQGKNKIENMSTGEPINITGYVHNTAELGPLDAKMEFTVHAPNDTILAENRQVKIGECTGFAQSSLVFVPTVPGRYGISVDSYDAGGKQIGGGSMCCLTVSGRSVPSNQTLGGIAIVNKTANCDKKISDERNSILDLIDRQKAVLLAENDTDFEGLVGDSKYVAGEPRVESGVDYNQCSLVNPNIQIQFNVITPNKDLGNCPYVVVIEDPSASKVLAVDLGSCPTITGPHANPLDSSQTSAILVVGGMAGVAAAGLSAFILVRKK